MDKAQTYGVKIHKGHEAGKIETVAKSQDLRGLLDYARRSPVEKVAVDSMKDGGANLAINFADGAWALVTFASFSVAVGFVDARRSWGLKREDVAPHLVRWSAV